MTLGQIFFVIALLLFAVAGVGATIVPSPLSWGLFFMTLGLLLSGVPITRPSG